MDEGVRSTVLAKDHLHPVVVNGAEVVWEMVAQHRQPQYQKVKNEPSSLCASIPTKPFCGTVPCSCPLHTPREQAASRPAAWPQVPAPIKRTRRKRAART